jgi:predicted nucleotidyltransferase
MIARTTLTMSPEVAVRVRRFAHALQSSTQAKHVLAIIVAGSASRGEEIWHNGNLISDIDLMVVTRHTNPKRSKSLTKFISDYRSDGIDGGATPLPSLRRFRTFAFYEAQQNGIVVWGNYARDYLLPPMTSAEIPRWEAIRVLANRMFEHLKLACGRKSAEYVVGKSYEALAEASLAWEGRYRASYKERLAELIVRPPGLLSPTARSGAIEALSLRLGKLPSSARISTADTARRDLLAGLRDVLEQYLQSDGTVTELLGLLGQHECHWKHRAYWAMARPRNAAAMLRIDPSIALWQKAAEALQASFAPDQTGHLVDEWDACPSILRHHDPIYAHGLAAHASR